MDNLQLALQILPYQLINTLYMVFLSAFCAFIFGFPLGIILMLTDKGQLKENLPLHYLGEVFINFGRSIPFAILMIAIIPFTRWIVGTSLGTQASVVPLTIAAIPFVARLIETNLKEVDKHTVEAALMMGSTTWQIVTKVLIIESIPSIITTITLTLINLIGYSAMAGMVGGGGLGQVAIQYGYQRFNLTLMFLTVGLLIILVQLIQWTGHAYYKYILRKRGLYAKD